MVDLKNDQEQEGYGMYHYQYKKIINNPIGIAWETALLKCNEKYSMTKQAQALESCMVGVDKGRDVIRQEMSQKKHKK